MYVSVIVPHYNDLEALDICLAALAAQSYPAEQMEIIVADNASPQGHETVERIVGKRANLVTIRQRGAGPARNGGVMASRGDILAFIDSDCRPEPDWLANGVAALSDHDIVGGRVDVQVTDPDFMTPTEAFERVFAFNIEHYVTKKGFVGSGNLFCRRVVFDAVGPFGTGISEDVDWSHRAAAKHFRIGYCADAAVSHPARRSWQELRNKWSRINSETFALTMRRKSGRLSWLAVCFMLPGSAIIHAPRVLLSNRIKRQQKLGALGVLIRLRLWRMYDYWRLLVRGSKE